MRLLGLRSGRAVSSCSDLDVDRQTRSSDSTCCLAAQSTGLEALVQCSTKTCGCFSAISSNRSAEPDGFRKPCSHLQAVALVT